MSQAAASASASLSTQAVEVEPEVSSHAIEGTGDLASHAVEDAHEPIPCHALEDEGGEGAFHKGLKHVLAAVVIAGATCYIFQQIAKRD